eukprot:1160446-Pelagomonas_calceolata.AAC.5
MGMCGQMFCFDPECCHQPQINVKDPHFWGFPPASDPLLIVAWQEQACGAVQSTLRKCRFASPHTKQMPGLHIQSFLILCVLPALLDAAMSHTLAAFLFKFSSNERPLSYSHRPVYGMDRLFCVNSVIAPLSLHVAGRPF